jgi:transcriptional regulator with XRE-family HTH domain
MTQDNRTQRANNKVASQPHARVRTLARCRADFEHQVRAVLADRMALTEPSEVSARLKELRKRTGMKQYDVANALKEPPRTFQSWELAEVETDRQNYEKIARFYSRRLGEKITADWILFGQSERPAPNTPDLIETFSDGDSIEERLARIEARQKEMSIKLDALLLHFEISAAEIALARRDAEQEAAQASHLAA